MNDKSTDDKLRDLLFESGLTPCEIEARIAAFPKEQLVANAMLKIIMHRLMKSR